MDAATDARLARHIRDVPDFPRAGILFKDITPLLADADAFALSINELARPWSADKPDMVCGIEARGFIFGGALARQLGVGFVPLRKPGKLPAATVGVDFELEYATARLEIHADALPAGARVLVVDDVLATGGTLAAARQLLERLGAIVAGAAVVVELDALGGRARWPAGPPLAALLHY
ncbi:MAG TPA: adenine phosphoribosyltransferase [Rhodanobacteraceae bacterium]|nr:adenine phosphoribosyltransferase [Rhodanobacteraceae bacterium]